MKTSLFKKVALATSILIASYFSEVSISIRPKAVQAEPQTSQEVQYKDYEGLEDKLGAYFTVDEYEKKMEEIVKENPKLASLEKIGETWYERPIYALKISDENEYVEGMTKKEPQVLILAHQHARELISGMTAIATAEYLTKNYDSDKKVKSCVDNNEIYIIPLGNPDGLAIIEGSQKQVVDVEKSKEYLEDPLYMFDPYQPGKKIDAGTKLKETRWRKNARDNNEDGIILPAHDGVDLNRNYSIGWVETTKEFSYLSDYPGTSPFSEPETKAVRQLVERLDNLVIAIDMHSYSGLVLYPPAYKKGESEDEKLFRSIAEEMIKRQPYEKYGIKKFSELYSVPTGGTFIDWAYFEHDVLSFTIEVYKKGEGHLPDIVNFNPPQQDIKKVTENVLPMLLHLFEISGEIEKS